MPLSYNSPARNFFLLASTGQQEITAFLRRITTPSPSDTFGYEPARIEYEETDQEYLLTGSQVDAQGSQLYEGFLTKAAVNGAITFDRKIQSTIAATDYGTTIRSMAQDSNGNIIVCGRKGQAASDTAGSPYVGKFDFDGLNIWFQSTNEVSENAKVEYTDITIDSNDDIYVVGYDPTISANNSILSKYLSNGTLVWSKKLLDDGSDGFGDFKFRNVSINSRDELIVTGSLEGITKRKGVVAKYDTFGNQIWIKTFEDPNLGVSSNYLDVTINSSYVDGNDYIYCVGDSYDSVSGVYSGIAFRLTPEGNIVWQKKTNYSNSIRYTSVSADTLTGQMILAGDVWAGLGTGGFTIAQRFTASGFLTWTRKLSSVNARSAYVNISSDPSYYYLIFADELTSGSDPESFLYGKLSITGNGLGAFAYNDGVTDQNYVVIPLGVKNGTLTDGSLRNDASDFITYPHNAVKVLFDDLTMIYQPKQPVHDGSDHEIITQNILGAAAVTVTAFSDTEYIDTSSFYNVVVASNGTGIGQNDGFAIGDHLRFGPASQTYANTAWTGSNNIAVTSARVFDTFALDLRTRATLTFTLIRGNIGNGGETPDVGEDFRWWYSIDGKSTWVEIGVVAAYNGAFTTLTTLTATLPVAARTQATYLRIGQRQSSGYQFDHWGLTQFVFDQVIISDPVAPKISADGIVYGSDLLLNYDFNNLATYSGSGGLVYNLSSTSYTGTINGGTTFNSAGYFVFDGSNDDISVSSLPAFADAGAITIESWANADTTTNTFQVISTAKATTTHWQLSFTGDPTYNILWAFAGTANSVGTTTLPSTGAWHHITATYNGGDKTQLASWKVYIDGSEATIQLTGSTGAATNDTIIGHRSGGPTGNRFDGNIGEVRIYNRALTATEVSQNFNATRDKYGV